MTVARCRIPCRDFENVMNIGDIKTEGFLEMRNGTFRKQTRSRRPPTMFTGFRKHD
jgi:hypothetical protein